MFAATVVVVMLTLASVTNSKNDADGLEQDSVEQQRNASVSRETHRYSHHSLDQAARQEDEVPCSSDQGWTKYKCYKGWRYGCYKPPAHKTKYCWRTKWQTSSRWGYFENRTYSATQKGSKNVICSTDQDCLDYWNEKPDDMPCYKSSWKGSPCYKGRRYGCGKKGCWSETDTRTKEHNLYERFEPLSCYSSPFPHSYNFRALFDSITYPGKGELATMHGLPHGLQSNHL